MGAQPSAARHALGVKAQRPVSKEAPRSDQGSAGKRERGESQKSLARSLGHSLNSGAFGGLAVNECNRDVGSKLTSAKLSYRTGLELSVQG